MVSNPPANAGDARDVRSIPGSGRFPGEENGNPLQYSCLEDAMDNSAPGSSVHGAARSQTRPSNLTLSLQVARPPQVQ